MWREGNGAGARREPRNDDEPGERMRGIRVEGCPGFPMLIYCVRARPVIYITTSWGTHEVHLIRVQEVPSTVVSSHGTDGGRGVKEVEMSLCNHQV